MSDELERLRRRNKLLTKLCMDLAELLNGVMQASAKDDPRLLTLPNFIKGQQTITRVRLLLDETKGTG